MRKRFFVNRCREPTVLFFFRKKFIFQTAGVFLEAQTFISASGHAQKGRYYYEKEILVSNFGETVNRKGGETGCQKWIWIMSVASV